MRISPETSQLWQPGPCSPLRRPCPHLGPKHPSASRLGILWGDRREELTPCSKPGPLPCRAGGSRGTGPAGTASPGRGETTARGRHSRARPRAGKAAHAQLGGRRPRRGCHGGRRRDRNGGFASLRVPPAGSRTPGARALTPPALLPCPLHTHPWARPPFRLTGRCSRSGPPLSSRRRRPGPGGGGGGSQHGAVWRGGAAEGQCGRPGERWGRGPACAQVLGGGKGWRRAAALLPAPRPLRGGPAGRCLPRG